MVRQELYAELLRIALFGEPARGVFSDVCIPFIGWSGGYAQVVAVGVGDPEVPESPGTILERLENRITRGTDAGVPLLDIVHLQDDLYPLDVRCITLQIKSKRLSVTGAPLTRHSAPRPPGSGRRRWSPGRARSKRQAKPIIIGR